MLTKKEREILRDLCKDGSKRFGAKDLETYQKLEAQGLIYYYYEYGRWNAEITSEGIKALSDSENKISFVEGVVAIAVVVLIGLLLSGCSNTKEISNHSNRMHSDSYIDEHLARELLSEIKKQSQTRVDNITTRDSVKYTERNIDGSKICETEIIKWRDREVTVHDTIYIEKNDSTSIKDKSEHNTTDDNSQETTVEKQPSWWQRMKEGLAWGFVLLVALGALYVFCKILRRK